MELSARTRIATLLPPLAGLTVAAVVAFSASTPPIHYPSFTRLLGFALQQVLTVSLSCVLTIAVLSALISRAGLDQHSLLIDASRAALWLAPLALLLRANSLWALLAVAAFAVLVTPSLSLLRPAILQPGDSVLFSLHPDNLPLFPKVRPQVSIGAALFAEIGVLVFFAGESLIGALLFGLACCVWAWWAAPAWEPAVTEPRQFDTLLLASLSLVFTIGALLPYLRGAKGVGLGSSHRYAAHVAEKGTVPAHPRAMPLSEDSSNGASEGNSGIILWPEKQTATQIVAPTPIDLTSTAKPGSNANPVIIPFDGVYWFFKSPDVRPPKTSRQARASPEAVEIRSTDRRPLSIEAHDYLGTRISLDCCSRIQIAIRNADRYPDTVSLELILIDTSEPHRPSQSLGAMLVKSTRPWRIYERPEPVTETLNFSIPSRSALRHFDEVEILFRLDRARADAGARIAIDHFVLVPRGL